MAAGSIGLRGGRAKAAARFVVGGACQLTSCPLARLVEQVDDAVSSSSATVPLHARVLTMDPPPGGLSQSARQSFGGTSSSNSSCSLPAGTAQLNVVGDGEKCWSVAECRRSSSSSSSSSISSSSRSSSSSCARLYPFAAGSILSSHACTRWAAADVSLAATGAGAASDVALTRAAAARSGRDLSPRWKLSLAAAAAFGAAAPRCGFRTAAVTTTASTDLQWWWKERQIRRHFWSNASLFMESPRRRREAFTPAGEETEEEERGGRTAWGEEGEPAGAEWSEADVRRDVDDKDEVCVDEEHDEKGIAGTAVGDEASATTEPSDVTRQKLAVAGAGWLEVEDVLRVLRNTRGKDVVVLHVRGRCEWTDAMVVATGRSVRHMRGMADAVVFEIKQRMQSGFIPSGVAPLSGPGQWELPLVEGRDGQHWMLVDCGTVVVHLFSEEGRHMYRLEDLWGGRDGHKLGRLQ